MELPTKLTPSQIRMIELASDGLTDKEICLQLGIAPGTLRTYWDRLRKRCNSRSRAEVIAKLQHGLPSNRLKLILLEKMPFYIWTMDEAGRVEYCNEWFLSSGGLDRKVAQKQGILPLVVEEEKVEYQQFVTGALKSESLSEAEWHITPDKGESRRRHKIRLIPMPDCHRWICYGRELAANADNQMSLFLKAILA